MSSFQLTTRAFEFYRCQRCSSKKMSREEAEKYLYDFHYGIFLQMKPFLSPGVKAIDIGCGLGALNIFLKDYFQQFYLIDKTVQEEELSKVFYGFHGSGYKVDNDFDQATYTDGVSSKYCFYNDLNETRNLLSKYMPKKELHFIEADEVCWSEIGNVDFVHSDMSWGWHYPLDLYYNSVYRVLKRSGILIIDIRDGAASAEDFKGFKVIEMLPNRETNSLKYVLEKC